MSKPLQHQSHVLDDDATIAVGFHPLHGGVIGGQQSRADGVVDITNAGGAAGTHYGVLGTCHSALAYYEAAAHGIMDELESGPTKGKVVSVLILFWAMNFLFIECACIILWTSKDGREIRIILPFVNSFVDPYSLSLFATTLL